MDSVKMSKQFSHLSLVWFAFTQGTLRSGPKSEADQMALKSLQCEMLHFRGRYWFMKT